ncbi:hypothetical protein EFR00_18565 [Rhizobium sophoriradicis]|nr:hypothetical protein EFR00_18565 [Rhizobium sophoriradicis]
MVTMRPCYSVGGRERDSPPVPTGLVGRRFPAARITGAIAHLFDSHVTSLNVLISRWAFSQLQYETVS